MKDFRTDFAANADPSEWRVGFKRGRAFYDRYTGGPSDFIRYPLSLDGFIARGEGKRHK